jgi:hypothetical protein
VVPHLQELAGVADNAPDREPRLREFCERFAERAFRRPLSDEQKRIFIIGRFEGARDFEIAVKRVVLMVLKSPQFLYREIDAEAQTGASKTQPRPPDASSREAERVKKDGYDVASRISFGLWDSLPDRELLEAAAAGRLATREQVVRQAERMLADQRTRAKIRDFLLQWLKVDPAPDISKPKELYPEFDKPMASDLRTSLELFLDDVVWSESSDYRQLFLADYFLSSAISRGLLLSQRPVGKILRR